MRVDLMDVVSVSKEWTESFRDAATLKAAGVAAVQDHWGSLVLLAQRAQSSKQWGALTKQMVKELRNEYGANANTGKIKGAGGTAQTYIARCNAAIKAKVALVDAHGVPLGYAAVGKLITAKADNGAGASNGATKATDNGAAKATDNGTGASNGASNGTSVREALAYATAHAEEYAVEIEAAYAALAAARGRAIEKSGAAKKAA